jgi:hypothetical protein
MISANPRTFQSKQELLESLRHIKKRKIEVYFNPWLPERPEKFGGIGLVLGVFHRILEAYRPCLTS